MISAIIATHDSERALVPTLAALVPAAVSGLVADVVVADRNSSDATREVADVAGCRFIASAAPLGERLKQAAAQTRTPWLMFLRAGAVPEPAWVNAAERFIAETPASDKRAAVFRASAASGARPSLADLFALLRALLGGAPRAEQGLIVSRAHYDELGGHRSGDNADADLLRRIGSRRLAVLGAAMSASRT
jgi:glycosyltransferase involved in cell wall biosynthesis